PIYRVEHLLDDGVIGMADVEPEAHGRGDDVRPTRVDERAPDSGNGARVSGGRWGRDIPDHTGGRDHRIGAMAHRRRAGMLALPGEGEVPATVADDRGADRHGLIGARQTDAQLDLELDERTDPGQPRRITPDPIQAQAIATGAVGEGVADRVLETECAVGLDRAGEQPRTEAGDTEARALFLREHGQREGSAGPLERARGLQLVEGR